MNISRLSGAMTDIGDDLLDSAMSRTPKRRISWMKAAALAACFVFAITAGAVGIGRKKQDIPVLPDPQAVKDNKLDEGLTADDIKNTRFGAIFPNELPEGYVLDGDIGIYDDTVLKASYSNGDGVLTVEIADKDWFDDVTDGLYVECDGIGAVYSFSDGHNSAGLINTAMSAECFSKREVVEVPHSYDAAEAANCEHKYYNVTHNGDPTLYEFDHMCTNGMTCTATLEEYWHDMTCCACGEVFGGYFKVCRETHSLTLEQPVYDKETDTTFFGYCGTMYKGFCYPTQDRIGLTAADTFQGRIDEWFTYGCPLSMKRVIDRIRGDYQS